jgi:integrase
MFGWLVQKRRLEKNPCAGLHREAPEARDRVLTDAEIAVFWRACGEVSEPFAQVLRLLLLTGCRLNEVAGMRRETRVQDSGDRGMGVEHRGDGGCVLAVAAMRTAS